MYVIEDPDDSSDQFESAYIPFAGYHSPRRVSSA
jgi:hypothetical protein